MNTKKIEIGKYTLYSDTCSMWITEKYINKKDKPDEKRVSGYHVRYKDLLESFIRYKNLGVEANTVKDTLVHLVEIEKDAVNICNKILADGGRK